MQLGGNHNSGAAKLTVWADENRPVDVVLRSARLTIGRHPSCHLVLNSRYVSRLHASVERRDGRYVLSDEGSRNGVFVNAKRITQHELRNGDEIAIGVVKLIYRLSTSDDETTAPFGNTLVAAGSRACSAIKVDRERHAVWVEGREVVPPLSRQEFELLAILCDRAGQICERSALGDAIWGVGEWDYNRLHRLVHRLREKLRRAGADIEAIVAIRGVGYRFDG